MVFLVFIRQSINDYAYMIFEIGCNCLFFAFSKSFIYAKFLSPSLILVLSI